MGEVGKERMELKNGFIVEQLYKHLVPMQQIYKRQKKRKRDDEDAKRNFFFFFDDYLLTPIESSALAISQKKIREKYEFGDYFRRRLELIFNVTTYDKNKKKAREYYLRDYAKEAIYKLLEVIVEKNHIAELSEIYEVGQNPTAKLVYKIPFSESKLCDGNVLEWEDLSLDENLSMNKDLIILNEKPFGKLTKATVNLPDKIYVKEIYNYSKKRYENLKKTDIELLFFDFTKSRKKIKQQQNKANLEKYIHTNVHINEQSINNLVNKYIKCKDNFLYIFGLLNILRHYKEGTNSILYEEKKFRLYSSKKLNFGVNFQSIKSDLRKTIFLGQYDYDINAGAPTLLYQYIRKKLNNENIELQYLEDYIKDRKVLRVKCAELLAEKDKSNNKSNNIKKYEKQVKEIFTALLYGSNIISSKSKVSMNFSNRKYLYDNFDEFRDLVEDVKQLFIYYKKYIKELKKESTKEGFIEIEEDVFIEIKESDKDNNIVNKKENSIISEIYFYLESKILKLVYENYKEDISLLIHDGFICRKNLEVKELENLVKEKLDFEVKYSKELL